MGSQDRYGKIKLLLESNTINRYSDIFEVAVTKTEVARDLNINSNRFTKLIASPGRFKMRQVIQQAELFHITVAQMIGLIEMEYSGKKERVDHAGKDGRYRQIEPMVKNGKIKRLDDVFGYVPRYVIARDIRRGRSDWKNHGSYTFDQVRTLAKLSELPFIEMYRLITHP